ncbi:MAG: YfiR/HmsC family protein, partial [Crocinitomicaceae bacterium]
MLKSAGMLLIFLILSFSAISSTREEQKEEARELIQSKVSFIQKVLNNVQFDAETDSKEFVLAIYGKNSASKDLYSALKSSMSGKSINGKPVTVKLFKRMNSVKAADLIYINGDTKVSLGDLKQKVGRKFVLLTEDFPYGQSMINFVVDEENGLSYTIQEEALEQQGVQVGGALKTSKQRIFNERSWIKRLNLAESKIKEQELTIVNQKDEIGEQSELIEKKSSTIEDQESTISEKSQKLKEKAQIISYQRTIIIGGIIGAIIILGLLFFLFRINQKRKVALLENEAKTKEIISSINYAERIQRASLPSSTVLEKSLQDGFVFYQPKDIVSGDFYWLEEHENVVYFAVADCTGHGVPGALLSVLCSNSLSRSINELGIKEPARILDQTVLHLEGFFSKSGDELQDGMDIALCRLDKSKNQLQYAGANRPLYYFTEGVFNEIKADRQPIGKYD